MSVLEFGGLVLDLLALERGESTQLHVEDGARLQLVDVEQRHQPVARGLGVGAAADEGDDLVERVERLQVRGAGCASAPPPCAGGTWCDAR